MKRILIIAALLTVGLSAWGLLRQQVPVSIRAELFPQYWYATGYVNDEWTLLHNHHTYVIGCADVFDNSVAAINGLHLFDCHDMTNHVGQLVNIDQYADGTLSFAMDDESTPDFRALYTVKSVK